MTKRNPHILKEIKLIPKHLLRKDMSNDEILYIAQQIKPIYYTPGTAILEIGLKQNEAGRFFEKEFRYSVPSLFSSAEIWQK